MNIYLENFKEPLPLGLASAIAAGSMVRVMTPGDESYLLVHFGTDGFAERHAELARGPLLGALIVVASDAGADAWRAALTSDVEVVADVAQREEWTARAHSAMSRHGDAARAEFGQGRIELTRASLEMISMVDLRTGMYNRQFLLASLRDEVSAAKRYRRSLSLCIFRLMNAPEIAEKYGVERLTQVREYIADEIGAMLRGADVCAWTSEDAFAAMLPETSLEGAAVAQSRMDASLTELNAELDLDVSVRSVVGALNSADADEKAFLGRVERLFDASGG